jgi:hypothetical protein
MKRYKITFLTMKGETKIYHCVHLFSSLQEVENWAYEFAGTNSIWKNIDMKIKIQLITNKTEIYYYAGQE